MLSRAFDKEVNMGKRYTTESFITAADIKHCGKYLYTNTEFITSGTKTRICCRNHGEFLQTPAAHLFGQGCPRCADELRANKSKKPFNKFKEEVDAIHSGKYTYIEETYEGVITPMTIVCPIHGRFQQAPREHLLGKGCRTCGITASAEKRVKSIGDFITEATQVHGYKYDYSETKYESSLKKVKIRCTMCGEVFEQRAATHIRGTGCPFCVESGFQCGAIGSLYLLVCESRLGVFTGYGITNNFKQRMKRHLVSLSKSAFVITQQHTWDFPLGSSALALENAVKKQFPQTSRLGCAIEGFKRESTDAPFEQVKEFIESILKENPEWQLT